MEKLDSGRLLKTIEGLMEIAEIAMPDSFFWSDSRTKAARKQMEILRKIAPHKFRKVAPNK